MSNPLDHGTAYSTIVYKYTYFEWNNSNYKKKSNHFNAIKVPVLWEVVILEHKYFYFMA